MKTVLAPNAPWPTYAMSEPLKSLKQPSEALRKAFKKVRSKPSETDAKFEAWLLTIKPIGVERIKK